MAFEKAKVLKAAEKFLAQGKISAAIKEYRQIVENDSDDLTTLNMLGDLYVRAGKKDEAISCFQRIADHYSEQEFNLKAIAMYKKVDRLKPRDPEIANKLAGLYASQGLVVDARAQYLIVAEAYTRAGHSKRSLDILHKIADLDPQNTDIRLKLADGYLKEGMRQQAAEAFIEAATRFSVMGAFENAIESYTKALELGTSANAALRGMLEAHIALGTADEAAEILERAVAEKSDDVELITMLTSACLEAEDAKGAERATAMLMAQDPSNYPRMVEVAALYLKLGEIADTTRILAGIIEQMLAGREEKRLLEIVNEVLARNPESVEALRLLVRINWWQRDMEALRVALERLAESAEASGLEEEERYALTQLVRLAPDEQKYLDRLDALGGLQEDAADEPALPQENSLAEVPQFENFASVAPEASVQEEQFEWATVSQEAISDPSASFADLNEPLDHSVVTFAAEPEVQAEPGANVGADFVANEVSEVSATPTFEDNRHATLMRQELESVDFYITQGYRDIAADTLDLLERQFGAHPEIDARRSRVQHMGEPPEVFELGDAEVIATDVSKDDGALGFEMDATFARLEDDRAGGQRVETVNGAPSAVGVGIDSGLADILEEFRVAAEEEQPPAKGDYETHYNMGTAYKEMDLLDDAIQEFQSAVRLLNAGDGTQRFLQCCNMLGHCFVQKGLPRAAAIWFKKGLDSPGHSEDEYKALRYELGSVFEQMGDLDRAFDLYTEVYGADVGYREVGDRLRKLEQQRRLGKSSGRKL
jgi:tetratricopeptide (TPR) repeat protein